MTQWIVVDDSDSSISYDTVEHWSAVNGSIPGTVDLTNAIFQTGHVLSSNGSLSFAFTGTQIEMFGVSSKLNLSQADHTHDPSWTCSIDGISIPINATALRGFPWTSYCNQAGLDDRSHVLNVNITASQQRQFWLDYIRYVPTTPVANQTILVDSTDSAVHFPTGTGWESLGTAQFTETDPQNVTSLPPDSVSMSFTFNGAGITWYGLTQPSIRQINKSITGGFPEKPGLVLVTMDGVSQNVTIPMNPPSDPSYDQVLFNYPSLDPTKEHTLTATYNADPGVRTPPLTLDFLLVQTGPSGGTNSQPLPPISDPPPPPTVSQEVKNGSGSVHTAVIVGAVLGSVLFILILILILRYRRLRQRSARRARPHPSKNIAFVDDVVESFNVTQESESFPMRTSNTYIPSFSTPPPSTRTGSKFVEDKSIAEPVLPSHTTAPLHESPRETMYSMSSTRAQSMLVDYSGLQTASQTPSVNTVTNPFRRLNLASPSPESSFSDTKNRSSSNPFRGGL